MDYENGGIQMVKYGLKKIIKMVLEMVYGNNIMKMVN